MKNVDTGVQLPMLTTEFLQEQTHLIQLLRKLIGNWQTINLKYLFLNHYRLEKVEKLKDSHSYDRFSPDKCTFSSEYLIQAVSACPVIKNAEYSTSTCDFDLVATEFTKKTGVSQGDNILKYAMGWKMVYKFILSVLNHIVPYELFGSLSNFKSFKRTIKLLLLVGRKHRLYVENILFGVKISHCRWTCSCASFQQKSKMVAVLWIWLLKHFVMQILKAYFYITESNHKKHQLFYFRKRDWQSLNDIAYQKLLDQQKLKLLNRRQAIEMAKVNFKHNSPINNKPAVLRFIPKGSNDLRPIIPIGKGALNPSQLMKAKLLVNHMASFVFKGLPSVRNISSYQTAWLEYNQSLDKNKIAPAYAVKVDIKDAFGSVRHDLLVNLLNEARSKVGNSLLFCQYSALKRDGKIYKRKTYMLVDGEHVQKSLPLVKVGHPLKISTDETIKDILRVLTGQVIRVGSHRRLWFTRGIAQGASLSSALCELYYAAMCQKYLIHFQGKQRALLRSVDDFLYITPCKEQAIEFLKLMENGIKEYNCYINETKTVHNINGNNYRISFRGNLYCTVSKQILVSTDLLATCPPRYSLCLNQFQNSGKFVITKLHQISKAQLTPLTFHPRVASTNALVANIWRCAITVGGRLVSLIKALLLPTKLVNAEFICGGIIEVCDKIWLRIKRLWAKLNFVIPFCKRFLLVVFLGGIFNVVGLPKHPPLLKLRTSLRRKIRFYLRTLTVEQIELLPRCPRKLFLFT